MKLAGTFPYSLLDSIKRLGKCSLTLRFFIFCIIFCILSAPILFLGNNSLLGQDLDSPNGSAQQESTDQTIKDLIPQLGSAEFALRNQAEEKLRKLGAPTIPLLRKALTQKESDNEIRLRAVRLLIVAEREFKKAKIEKFLNGTGNSVNFPGWPEFSKIAGDDKDSRRLFVKTHAAQAELLKLGLAKQTSQTESKLLEEKFRSVASRSLYLSSNGSAKAIIGNLAAAIFVAAEHSPNTKTQALIEISEDSYVRIFNVLIRAKMVSTVKSDGSRKALEALISNWLNSVPDKPTRLLANKITVIRLYKMKSELGTVVRYALNNETPARIRASALETLSQLGDATKCKSLATLFADTSLVGNYLPMKLNVKSSSKASQSKELIEVQIRDLALATSIILSQQNVGEFGFPETAYENNSLFFSQAGFISDELRAQAFKKWNTSTGSPE